MILLLDNYDSFTFNLFQYLLELGEETVVYRNDRITLEEIEFIHPDRIVLSPGPGRPENAGIMIKLIRQFSARLPILGICLGCQGLAQAFGGRIVHAPDVCHGKTSPVFHSSAGMFAGLQQPVIAGRYHSLMIDGESLPDCYQVTAWTEDGIIMGIRHREYPVEGIQFHPESILTIDGMSMLKNYLHQPLTTNKEEEQQ